MLKAFAPLLSFLLLFSGGSIYLSMQDKMESEPLIAPLVAVFFAFFLAIFLNFKKLEETLEHILDGMRDHNIITMCMIYLLAGAFSGLSVYIGAVDATVQFFLYWIPGHWMLPGMFVMAALIGTSMGTSMGTIAALGPIAFSIANSAALPLPLMMGAMISGAMCGDNISMISDTTIASVQSIGANLQEKFIVNLKLIFPIFIAVFFIFYFAAPDVEALAPHKLDALYRTLPYLIVFGTALAGVNVFLVLIYGILSVIAIGLFDQLSVLHLASAMNQGLLSMTEILVLSLMIGGLSHLLDKQHGIVAFIHYIRDVESEGDKKRHDTRVAELSLCTLSALADAAVANNTVALLLVKEAGLSIHKKYGLSKAYIASLLDIFACAVQGILPYGAQLLLAASIAGLSPFDLLGSLYFSYGLIGGVFLQILFNLTKKVKK